MKTDADGVPVENDESFPYEVTVSGGAVTLTGGQNTAETMITNRKREDGDSELIEEGEDETGSTTSGEEPEVIQAGTRSVKTGDETSIGLYLALFLGAALILILAFVLRRRGNKE